MPLSQWTWIWANLGSQYRTEEPDVLCMVHGVTKNWTQLGNWTTNYDFINSALHIHIHSRLPLCWLKTAKKSSYHLLQHLTWESQNAWHPSPREAQFLVSSFTRSKHSCSDKVWLKPNWTKFSLDVKIFFDCTNCGFSFLRDLQTMPGSLSVRDMCESCPEQGVGQMTSKISSNCDFIQAYVRTEFSFKSLYKTWLNHLDHSWCRDVEKMALTRLQWARVFAYFQRHSNKSCRHRTRNLLVAVCQELPWFIPHGTWAILLQDDELLC